jgi:hypothetical protein
MNHKLLGFERKKPYPSYICSVGLTEATKIVSRYSQCPTEIGTDCLQNINSRIFLLQHPERCLFCYVLNNDLNS